MSFYQWRETMSVGLEQLDADHRALIQLVNRLHDCWRSGNRNGQFEGIYESLLAYARFHFTREERVIQVTTWPARGHHSEGHAIFVEQIRALRDRNAGSDEDGTGELLDFLKQWLDEHILVQDQAYKPYVENNPWARDVACVFGPGFCFEI